MIRDRIYNTTIRCFIISLLLLLLSGFVFAESTWEGSAAVGRYGEFPASGYYAATNAFPTNTALVVENLETGQTTSVIVVDRVQRPGLFMLVSRDAAMDLGMAESAVTQVRVVIEETSSTLLPESEDDMALSLDPDLNPAVSAGGVEDLAFLEEYVAGGPPITEEPVEEPVIEPVEEDLEPLLPPLEDEPEEEETVEDIIEEIPPVPVLKTEDVAVKTPPRKETDFSLTEVPETPEAAKSEVVLTAFDSDSLIAPPVRGISRSVRVVPEPALARVTPDTIPGEEPGKPEVPDYTDIPQVSYPPERIVASSFETPAEPYFEAPEEVVPEEEVPSGPAVEFMAFASPLDERRVSLSVAAVPEEPSKPVSEMPRTTGYAAPSAVLYEIACADIPAEPVPDVPEISGGYLAAVTEPPEYALSDIPAPPEEAAEAPPEEEAKVDMGFAEPESEELLVQVEDVPVIEEEPAPEPSEEEEAEEEIVEMPVPEDVDLFLEPADMRPPEPIEEIATLEEEEPEPIEEIATLEEEEPESVTEEETAVVVELVEEEAPEEEPVEVEVVEEEPAEVAVVEAEPSVPRVAVGEFPVSSDLVPSTHYLQLGVFSEERTARGAAARIGSRYPITILLAGSGDDARYKLFVGPLSPDESGALLYRFRSAGYRDAFVRVTN